MEEEIFIEEDVLSSDRELERSIDVYFPEDIVETIARFLPYQILEDGEEDQSEYHLKTRYPLHCLRLVSKSWNRACCRDVFWVDRFQRLGESVQEKYNWNNLHHRSLYTPRPIPHKYLVQRFFKNDESRLVEIIGDARETSEGYQYYINFLDLMRKLQILRSRQRNKEMLRTRKDLLLRFYFEQRGMFYQTFLSFIFLLLTFAIQGFHSFYRNHFYVTNYSFQFYVLVVSCCWTVLILIFFVILFELYCAYHICRAKRVITRWKYKDFPVFLARTVKQMDKNMRCKVGGLCVLLLILSTYISSLMFIQANVIWNASYRFSIVLPVYLTCFALAGSPVLLALLNGGMLSDGFPAVARLRRIISCLFVLGVAGGYLTFTMLTYYTFTSDDPEKTGGAGRKRSIYNLVYFESTNFTPCFVAEGSFFMFIAWKIFETYYFRDNNAQRDEFDSQSIQDFYDVKGKVQKWVIWITCMLLSASLMVAHVAHMVYNDSLLPKYNILSTEQDAIQTPPFAIHLLFYNFSLFLIIAVLFMHSRWGMKNEFEEMEFDTKYHSDYDSEYAM